MKNYQQQIIQLPGGIQPHYCRLCSNLPVIVQAVDRRNEETVTDTHIRQRFTLQQVCEFANSGCLMFVLRLKELCLFEKDDSFLINRYLCDICEAAYNKRLQLFYPLDSSRVPNELEHWSLEITWSYECVTFDWTTWSGPKFDNHISLKLFAQEGDFSYSLRLGAELSTSFR